MFRSIKQQMMVAFSGIVILMMVLFLIINGGFLEKYYVFTKQADFVRFYELLEKDVKDGTLEEETPEGELGKKAEKSNIAILVVNQDYDPIYLNARDMQVMVNQLFGYLYNKNNQDVLKETDNYSISKSTDVRSNTEYIEMWGSLSDGSIFMMRSPLESIRNAIDIFNRFLWFVGGILCVLSLGFAWYFSRRLSEPILELAELSKKMADLDFEAKYSGGGTAELDVLGKSYNAMSEKLEQTISNLKKANNELMKDIEQKEKLDSMRTEFLANVSHELKTPIALIQGYAEGLKEGVNDDPESRDFYCDVIMDEAGKMNKLVRNLLDLNQLEFGKDNLQFERFDMRELIRGVLQSSEIMIEQKEAKVIFRQENPVYVWGDEFKVEQVVRNYFTNALNHTEEDKVIEIKMRKHDDKVRISVFNTGKPIPEEDLDQIWDKFYKVDKARTRAYGGNGIGLSIVKAIMNSLQQEYGVQNYENGVEFWFELDSR